MREITFYDDYVLVNAYFYTFKISIDEYKKYNFFLS